MKRNGRASRRSVAAILVLATLCACGGGDAQQATSGPTVVRSALLTTTGSIAGEFRGPAQFEITSHDAEAPRMTGTVKGTIPGYSGLGAGGNVESDRSIEFEFSFDINAACGV